MVESHNVDWLFGNEEQSKESQIVFTAYRVDRKELCGKKNIAWDKSIMIPTTKNDTGIMFIHEPGTHVGDTIEKYDRFDNVPALQNPNATTAHNWIQAMNDIAEHVEQQRQQEENKNALLEVCIVYCVPTIYGCTDNISQKTQTPIQDCGLKIKWS